MCVSFFPPLSAAYCSVICVTLTLLHSNTFGGYPFILVSSVGYTKVECRGRTCPAFHSDCFSDPHDDLDVFRLLKENTKNIFYLKTEYLDNNYHDYISTT